MPLKGVGCCYHCRIKYIEEIVDISKKFHFWVCKKCGGHLRLFTLKKDIDKWITDDFPSYNGNIY
jgi:hypothetical protein